MKGGRNLGKRTAKVTASVEQALQVPDMLKDYFVSILWR
jgi:hypothetical protein